MPFQPVFYGDKGLQMAVAVLDNFERLTEEQRRSLINQLKE
jgi:hypothetical protein